ncbi:MAG: hypothetical protein HOP02_08755, partial [Methylococcaceae bacterium]|nr:hypothetical protein [Methylococcaceae bacterium]
MKIRILFEDNWKFTLKMCDFLDAHHLYFKDASVIIEYCKKNKINIIFANNYRAQNFLQLNQESFNNENIKFLINSRYVIDTFVDKKKFVVFMSQQGFADYLPETYELDKTIVYPCIIKPKMGGIGKGVRIAYTEEDLKNIDEKKYLISEFLDGFEYATSIFYYRGEIVNHYTYIKKVNKSHYVLQHIDPKDIQEETCETPYLEIFLAVLRAANPNNETCQCSINYKIIADTPKIFEINCRIGYTLARHPQDFKDFIQSYLAVLKDNIEVAEVGSWFTPMDLASITDGIWGNLTDDLKINEVQYIYKYLQPGNLYVVRHDGWPNSLGYLPNEESAHKAINKGVVALMVSQTFNKKVNIPLLRVKNTYQALEKLAIKTSELSKSKRILIVGSYGKTGLKNNLYHLLKNKLTIYTRLDSANYSASTYCSLASLCKEHNLYIVELPIASKQKIIKRAQIIAPDICVLTSIGHEHIERFKTIDNIIENKVAVAAGLSENGKFIIPRESPHYEKILLALGKYQSINTLTFGYHQDCSARIIYQNYSNFGWDLIARIESEIVCYRLPFPEVHAPLSSLAVLLCAFHLNINIHDIVESYSTSSNFESSGRLFKLKHQNKYFYLYDQSHRGGIESYASFFETIRYFKPENQGKKIVLTSEFVDCKDNETQYINCLYFRQLIDKAGIDALYTVENFCEHINVLDNKNIWKNHAYDFNAIKEELYN